MKGYRAPLVIKNKYGKTVRVIDPSSTITFDEKLLYNQRKKEISPREEVIFEMLRRTLESVDELERNCVILKFYCRMKESDIALLLGVSQSAVSRALSRGKTELKEKMELVVAAVDLAQRKMF